MEKLKEILQGIAFLLIGIPVMIIASIMDQRCIKKRTRTTEKIRQRHQLIFKKFNTLNNSELSINYK